MKIDEMINRLEDIKKKWGNVEVVKDDYYTPASLDIQDLYIENREGNKDLELVLVVRA